MWKPKHGDQQVAAVPEAEQVARYAHLIEVLPETVTAKAHAAAFADLSADQRTELLDEVLAHAPEAKRDTASAEPDVLATLVDDAEPRDAMMRMGIAGVVASRFVHSAPVAAYFTVGAGSVSIDQQPPWVNELAHHESVPTDAGNVNHRAWVDFMPWT